eukprot:IDg10736t1
MRSSKNREVLKEFLCKDAANGIEKTWLQSAKSGFMLDNMLLAA